MRYFLLLLSISIILFSVTAFINFRPKDNDNNRMKIKKSEKNLLLEATSPSENRETKGSFINKAMSHLFKAGNGQTYGVRDNFHAMDKKRALGDIQMWTHIFLVGDGIISLQYNNIEVLLLTLLVGPLSFLYHYSYEKPSVLARIESISAKSAFIYGIAQISNAPTDRLSEIETILCISTAAIYITTNIKKELYDPWHSLMHVIPPLWVGIIASSHTQLLPLIAIYIASNCNLDIPADLF